MYGKGGARIAQKLATLPDDGRRAGSPATLNQWLDEVLGAGRLHACASEESARLDKGCDLRTDPT